MSLGCLICQRTEAERLISVLCTVPAQEKQIIEMITEIRGSKMEDDDRLPQHVCNWCFRQLDQAYSLRVEVRHSLRYLLLNPATIGQCLVCSAPNDEKELISIDSVYERQDMKISKMIEHLIGEQIRDRSSKYVCGGCQIHIDFAYELRRKCLESELGWQKKVSYAWEKMEVDSSIPEHLICDVYAEVVRDKAGKAQCSICLLAVNSKKDCIKCEGCKLQFRKCKTTDVRTLCTPAEESSAPEMNWAADEETSESEDEEDLKTNTLKEDASYLKMEYAELENSRKKRATADDYDDDDDDNDNDDNDNEDNERNIPKVPKRYTDHWAYVEEPEKVFDIFEEYPDDPFPTVLRKGPCCCKCLKIFATRPELADHLAQHHATPTGTGTFSCDVCRTLYAKKQALNDHRKSLDIFLYDFCSSCQLPFESPQMFRKHKVTYHMDLEAIKEAEAHFELEKVSTYNCCVVHCYNRYSSEERLREHLEVAHPNQKKEKEMSANVCQYCEMEHSDTDLLNHWRSEKEQYRCQIDGCNYTRTNKKTMWQHCSQQPHMKTYSETKTLAPNMKHFTVNGTLDSDTDILLRSCRFCCRCFLIFDTEEELAAHCDLHTVEGDKDFQCEVCKRRFTRVGLSHHNRLQEIPNHYYCRPCKTFLWRKLDYVYHKVANHLYDDDLRYMIHTEEDQYPTCCGCWNTFRTEDELLKHRKKRHPLPKTANHSAKSAYMKCDYCHQIMYSMKQLEKHITAYESAVTHSCKVPECNFQTKDMDQMRQHIFHGIHKSSTTGVIMKKATGPDDFRCCIRKCLFRTTDYNELIDHGQAEHTVDREESTIVHHGRPYSCPVCCKGFHKQITLYHHKLSKRKIACPNCRKKFLRELIPEHVAQCTAESSKATQQKQRNISNSAENESKRKSVKYVCNICGKQVKNIAIHMRSHENKREFVCVLCGASFNDIARLKQHSFVHSNVRKYPCRMGCDRRYKYTGDRDRHEKGVHLGIKPYTCLLCSESFIRERDLRLHQRKHTGRKLYPCRYCDESFDSVREFEDHSAEHEIVVE